MSGLLRGHRPLALMVSADEVPFCFAGFDALDSSRVILVPGLTGSPSHHMVLATSSRDTALIETSSGRCRAERRRSVDVATHHDGPDHSRRPVRQRNRDEPGRLAGEQRIDPRIGRLGMVLVTPDE